MQCHKYNAVPKIYLQHKICSAQNLPGATQTNLPAAQNIQHQKFTCSTKYAVPKLQCTTKSSPAVPKVHLQYQKSNSPAAQKNEQYKKPM